MIMLNYVSHELANKVYHLTQALNKTNDLVKILEEENKALKELVEKLEHQYQNDHELCEIY